MFKKVEENVTMIRPDMENIKKIQVKLLDMKNTSEVKNSLDRITAGEKINELEGIAIKTIQSETQREKILKNNGQNT